MKKILILVMVLFYSGCSKLNFLSPVTKEPIAKKREFSCEEKAEPKSLQLLEQKYRCTSH